MTAPTTERTLRIDPIVAVDDTAAPDEVAHVVNQNLPGNDVTTAYVFRTPLVALCGYEWVPSRDPEVLPVCGRCVEIADELVR